MIRTRLTTGLLVASVALSLTACDNYRTKPEPQYGSLTHRLTMVDADGKYYGTVELDPINGGKVLDNQGKLIGRVVSVPVDNSPAVLPPGTAVVQ